jgi:hypothetical protein
VTQLLAFPFAFGPDGAAVTVDDASDDYVEQQLQVIIGTRPGERPMCWPYGISDPAFDEIDPADIQAVLNDYGPYGVTVDGVVATPDTATQTSVVVSWQWADQGDDS